MARDSTAEDRFAADERGDSRTALDRRGYLRLSAGVAAGSAMGVGTVSASATDGRVVDVTDAGVDASGEDAIDGRVAELADDDTRLVFPAGTYRVDDVTLRNYDGLELVAPAGATLLFSNGPNSGLSLVDCSDVVVEGFTTDTAVSRVEAAAAETVDPVNTVEFAVDEAEYATYRFTVAGDVWRQPTDDGATQATTDVSGSSAEGALGAGVVTYEYTGAISDFQLLGDAVVTVNGRTVDDAFVDRRARPTTLTVENEASHSLDVAGDVESSTDGTYRFTGALSSLRVTEETTVELTRV